MSVPGVPFSDAEWDWGEWHCNATMLRNGLVRGRTATELAARDCPTERPGASSLVGTAFSSVES